MATPQERTGLDWDFSRDSFRVYMDKRFSRHAEATQADVTAIMADLPNDASVVEMAAGRGDLTEQLLRHKSADQRLTVIEMDDDRVAQLIQRFSRQSDPNTRMIKEQFEAHEADIVFMQNPDGNLLDLATARRVQTKLSHRGQVVIYRDYQVNPDGIRTQNYLDYLADKERFRTRELFDIMQTFRSQLERLDHSNPIVAVLLNLIDEQGTVSIRRLPEKPLLTNDVADVLAGHLLEWARLHQIYTKAGAQSIEITYLVHSWLEDVATLDPVLSEPLSPEQGYRYICVGGARLIFKDHTIPPGKVQKIYGVQKMLIQFDQSIN